MTEAQRGESAAQGSFVYEQLRAFHDGRIESGGYELPLFTDCSCTGGASVAGPWTIINAWAVPGPAGLMRPTLRVRGQYVEMDEKRPSFEKTDTFHYHGGEWPDELAALISLTLGIRAEAGAVDREFATFDGPGHPTNMNMRPWPVGFLVPQHGQLQIPSARSSPLLNDEAVWLIDGIDRLTVKEAMALTKASVAYRRALWVAETDAAQSWLLFVSAAEAVARVAVFTDVDDVAILKGANPKLASLIDAKHIPGLIEDVAGLLRDQLRVMKHFVSFLIAFLPKPPAERPPFQIQWTPAALEPMLAMIYNYRSKALHDGTPFPAPMCSLPIVDSAANSLPYERHPALGMSAKGGVWRAEDCPMHLHVFEFIVRGAIHRWCRSRMFGETQPSN